MIHACMTRICKALLESIEGERVGRVEEGLPVTLDTCRAGILDRIDENLEDEDE